MTEVLLDKLAPRKRALQRIMGFMEYLLMLVVLLDCNSMYTYATETVGRVDMYLLFYRLALLLVGSLLALHVWTNPEALRALIPYGLVLVGLIAWAGGFFLLNVSKLSGWTQQNYALNFLLLLPLLAALFKVKQLEGNGFDLLFKYSEVACALGTMSLVVYLASVIRVDSVPADLIYTRWNDRGASMARISLLDVCQLTPGSRWQIFGISLLRDRGPFVEPLMFALPLLVGLYTELFLRGKPSRGRIFRCILLTATLIVVNATIGLMLMAAAWGLKGLHVCLRHGKRWLVIPILLAALCTCGVLYIEKNRTSYEDTEVSGSSISTHIDDHKVTLRAFAQKPLLGGGYHNELYIRSFMREYRLEKNPGLSNTSGVILAEGGLMLGLLCMLPFLIWLLFFFKKRDGRVALWGIGPIGLFVGIIFKYHMLLIMLIAFGYSLLDVRKGTKRLPMKLALADASGWDAETDALAEKTRNKRFTTMAMAGVTLLAIALVCFGAPIWQALHTLLVSHQFSVGQAPLRSFSLAIALLLHGVSICNARNGMLSWVRILGLLAWDAVYYLAYPAMFSTINTVLPMLGLWGELRECALLLAAWLIPTLVILWITPKRWRNRKGAILAAAVIAIICGVVFGTSTILNRASCDEALRSALDNLTACASGRVYVNDRPMLYAQKVKGVSLTTTRDTGYEVKKKASIVFAGEAEHRELLERGFQVAQLVDGYLVYSDDESVIEALTAQGKQFYRYYAFGHAVDLEALANRNALSLTEDGAVIVDGPIESLVSGPYATLMDGQYKVVYKLHIDPRSHDDMPEDARVCRAALTWDYGKEELAQQNVLLSDFDEQGNATAEVPFKLNQPRDGVEYHLFGEGDFRIEVSSISVVQAPDYITITTYNSHRDVTREDYYNLDGTPLLQDGVYSTVRRDVDMGGRVKAFRYYDADGKPVLVGSGYAEVHNGYNAAGSLDYQAFFGTDGEPIMISRGYSSMRSEYDGYGNPIITRYYDENGAPVINSDGYAVLKRFYNDRRQAVREEYYGCEGQPIALPTGEAAVEIEYDVNGNAVVFRYRDAEGNPVMRVSGYAEQHIAYNEAGEVVERSYFDTNGQLALIGFGFSKITYEYDSDQQLSLVYYWNMDGDRLQAGSGYMHEYLQSLIGRNITIFISVRNEGTKSLTSTLLQDLGALGIQTDLSDKYCNSYYAVLSPQDTTEAVSDSKALVYTGVVGEMNYTIESAGCETGDYSSIVIDGVEYSKNSRGMNIAVYDNEKQRVVEALAFDTYAQEMTVTR